MFSGINYMSSGISCMMPWTVLYQFMLPFVPATPHALLSLSNFKSILMLNKKVEEARVL